MKDEFPKNWYLIIDDDNRKIIDDWRKNSQYGGFSENKIYKYLTDECWIFETDSQVVGLARGPKEEITTEQFKLHILKLEPEIQISKSEDCKHLIKLFKKLKIK